MSDAWLESIFPEATFGRLWQYVAGKQARPARWRRPPSPAPGPAGVTFAESGPDGVAETSRDFLQNQFWRDSGVDPRPATPPGWYEAAGGWADAQVPPRAA